MLIENMDTGVVVEGPQAHCAVPAARHEPRIVHCAQSPHDARVAVKRRQALARRQRPHLDGFVPGSADDAIFGELHTGNFVTMALQLVHEIKPSDTVGIHEGAINTHHLTPVGGAHIPACAHGIHGPIVFYCSDAFASLYIPNLHSAVPRSTEQCSRAQRGKRDDVVCVPKQSPHKGPVVLVPHNHLAVLPAAENVRTANFNTANAPRMPSHWGQPAPIRRRHDRHRPIKAAKHGYFCVQTHGVGCVGAVGYTVEHAAGVVPVAADGGAAAEHILPPRPRAVLTQAVFNNGEGRADGCAMPLPKCVVLCQSAPGGTHTRTCAQVGGVELGEDAQAKFERQRVEWILGPPRDERHTCGGRVGIGAVTHVRGIALGREVVVGEPHVLCVDT
eukprot:Opistho-2@5601